jgi:hypothetical protein
VPDELTSGTVYLDHVNKLLDSEVDQRRVLESRGESIIKTSTGIITLILALTTFIYGKNYKFTDHWDSLWVLSGSLVFFLLSAVVAIYVQSWALKYTYTKTTTLQKMPRELWSLSGEDAQRMCLQRIINSTVSLREGNAKKVAAAQYAIMLQVIAIALLCVSFVCELRGHH